MANSPNPLLVPGLGGPYPYDPRFGGLSLKPTYPLIPGLPNYQAGAKPVKQKTKKRNGYSGASESSRTPQRTGRTGVYGKTNASSEAVSAGLTQPIWKSSSYEKLMGMESPNYFISSASAARPQRPVSGGSVKTELPKTMGFAQQQHTGITVPLVRLSPHAKATLPLPMQQHMLRLYLQWYGSGQLLSDPHKAKLAHDARQSGYIIDPTQGGLYPHKTLIAPPPKPFVSPKPAYHPGFGDYARSIGHSILQSGLDYMTGIGQQITAPIFAQAHGEASLYGKIAAGIDRTRHHPGAAGHWDAYAKHQKAQMVGSIYGPRHDKSAIARTLGSVPADLFDIANGLLIQAPIQAQQEKMNAAAALYNLYAAGGSALVGHKKAALGHLRTIGAIGSQMYNDELSASGLNPPQPSILTDSATDLGFYAGDNPNNMGGRYAGHIGRNIRQFTTEHPVQQAMNVLSVVEPVARVVPFARAGLARFGSRMVEGADAEANIVARHEVRVNPNAPKGKPYGVWDHQAPGTKNGDWVRTKQGFARVYSTQAEAKKAIPRQSVSDTRYNNANTRSTFGKVPNHANQQPQFAQPRPGTTLEGSDHGRVQNPLARGATSDTGYGRGAREPQALAANRSAHVPSYGRRPQAMGRADQEGRWSASQYAGGERIGEGTYASRGGGRSRVPGMADKDRQARPGPRPITEAPASPAQDLLVGKAGRKMGQLWVSNGTHEILTSIMSQPELEGITLNGGKAELLAKTLDQIAASGRFDAETQARFVQLAAKIRQVSTKNPYGEVVINRAQGYRNNISVARHEYQHQVQSKYGMGDPANALASGISFEKLPTYMPASQKLAQMYAPYAGRGTVEIPAWIANGQWRDIGLTKDEAYIAFRTYLRNYAQRHGVLAVREVGLHTTGVAREAYRDFLRQEARRYPSVQPPGATGWSRAPGPKPAPGIQPRAFSSPGRGPTKQTSLPPGFVPAMINRMPGLDNLYGLTPEQRRRLLERF